MKTHRLSKSLLSPLFVPGVATNDNQMLEMLSNCFRMSCSILINYTRGLAARFRKIEMNPNRSNAYDNSVSIYDNIIPTAP